MILGDAYLQKNPVSQMVILAMSSNSCSTSTEEGTAGGRECGYGCPCTEWLPAADKSSVEVALPMPPLGMAQTEAREEAEGCVGEGEAADIDVRVSELSIIAHSLPTACMARPPPPAEPKAPPTPPAASQIACWLNRIYRSQTANKMKISAENTLGRNAEISHIL